MGGRSRPSKCTVYREETGANLKEAKEAVEACQGSLAL